MIEYELMSLALADANVIEETTSLMLDDPFSNRSLNTLLGLVKQELKGGRKPRVAGMFAKKEFMRLTGLKSTLNAIADHRGVLKDLEQYDIDIKEAWDKRQLSLMAQDVLIDANDGASTDEITSKVNKALDDIENANGDEDEQSIEEATIELMERWNSIGNEDTSHLIPTGIPDIDEKIIGFPIGEHSVIGARPSVGKTALGLTCMSNQDNNGIGAGFLSFEMKTSQCIERIGQIRSGVSAKDAVLGKVSKEGKADLMIQIQRISADNTIQLIHSNNRRLSNAKRLIRKMKKKNPDLKVVYLDYLQLLNYGDKSLSKTENIESCTESLTLLAHELQIALVSLAQLNRDSKGKPEMHHLKGSGQIEQDAYIVILIDREVSADGNGDEIIHDCAYHIAKNRDGMTGPVPGKYISNTTKFESYYYYEDY